jgi:glycosyltransferase involved in cell wall biosynthesis
VSLNIIFWQPVQSPHVIYLAAELSKFNISVYYIVLNKKIDSHKSLGWIINDEKIKQVFFIDSEEKVPEDIFNDNSIHITSGINHSIIPSYFLKKIRNSGSIWVFMCEKFQTIGMFSFMRYIKYFLKLNLSYVKPDYFFTIGDDAYNFLRFLLIDKNKIFPFAYFIENNFGRLVHKKSDKLRIIFIGNLTKNKNVKLVLEALVKIGNPSFIFEIIGVGTEFDYLYNFVVNRPFLKDKVFFKGKINIDDIWHHFKDKDILVLPSKFDGWGVVATESVMAGVPVLVSSNCGSKDLIKISKIGYVSMNDQDFTKILKNCFHTRVTEVERLNLKTCGDKYSSINGAKYLINIINFIKKLKDNRPLPPWQRI